VLGVAIGVTWTAAKVAVPQLTKAAMGRSWHGRCSLPWRVWQPDC
jgi:hypothetical protein